MSDHRVDIGETHVTVFNSSNVGESAKILDREFGPDGQIVRLVLDRLVHSRFWPAYHEWKPEGFVATELVRRER